MKSATGAPELWEGINPAIGLSIGAFILASLAALLSGLVAMSLKTDHQNYHSGYTVGTCYVSDCAYQMATKEVHFSLIPYDFPERTIRSSMSFNLMEGQYFCAHIKEEKCLCSRDAVKNYCSLQFREPPTGQIALGVMFWCLKIMAGAVIVGGILAWLENRAVQPVTPRKKKTE